MHRRYRGVQELLDGDFDTKSQDERLELARQRARQSALETRRVRFSMVGETSGSQESGSQECVDDHWREHERGRTSVRSPRQPQNHQSAMMCQAQPTTLYLVRTFYSLLHGPILTIML